MINAARRAAIIDAVTALSDATLLSTNARLDALPGALALVNPLLGQERLGDIEAELEHIISASTPVVLGGKCFRGYTVSALTTALGAVAGPAIDTLSPVDDATDVPNNQAFEITFDQDVSLLRGSIDVYLASDDSLVESLDVANDQGSGAGTVSVSSDTVTFQFAAELAAEDDFYILFDLGIVAGSDGMQNGAFSDITAWSFTTAALATIDTLSPADDGTDVAIDADLIITFDQDVTLGSGTVELRATSGDALVDSWAVPADEGSSAGQLEVTGTGEVTMVLTAALTNSTGYYVLFTKGAFVDALGQDVPAVTAKTTWNFTTVAA